MQFQPAATLPGAVCCGLVNANKPQRENHRGLHCMYSHDSFLLVIARAELVCYVHHTVFDGTHARRLLAARLTLADYQSNKKIRGSRKQPRRRELYCYIVSYFAVDDASHATLVDRHAILP